MLCTGFNNFNFSSFLKLCSPLLPIVVLNFTSFHVYLLTTIYGFTVKLNFIYLTRLKNYCAIINYPIKLYMFIEWKCPLFTELCTRAWKPHGLMKRWARKSSSSLNSTINAELDVCLHGSVVTQGKQQVPWQPITWEQRSENVSGKVVLWVEFWRSEELAKQRRDNPCKKYQPASEKAWGWKRHATCGEPPGRRHALLHEEKSPLERLTRPGQMSPYFIKHITGSTFLMLSLTQCTLEDEWSHMNISVKLCFTKMKISIIPFGKFCFENKMLLPLRF